MTTATPKRRWFQYSLRTLLVFVTLCAIACSWVAVKLQQTKRQQEAVAAVKRLGGYVLYDYQVVNDVDRLDWEAVPPGPSWLRHLMGDDVNAKVVGMTLIRSEVTDADLELIKHFPELRNLEIGDTSITDAELETVRRLTKLEFLGIGGTKVTNSGVIAFQKALPKCKVSRERPYHPGSTRTGSFLPVAGRSQ